MDDKKLIDISQHAAEKIVQRIGRQWTGEEKTFKFDMTNFVGCRGKLARYFKRHHVRDTHQRYITFTQYVCNILKQTIYINYIPITAFPRYKDTILKVHLLPNYLIQSEHSFFMETAIRAAAINMMRQ